jgi:SAM-dependent methyltransferase
MSDEHPSEASSPSTEARALNEELYREVRAIPPQELESFTELLKSLAAARGYNQAYTADWLNHRYRLYLSTQWIERYLGTLRPPLTCIELGGMTIVTALLRGYFEKAIWKEFGGDLRDPWPLETGSIDFIVCAEVLEHISDPAVGVQDTFRMSGIRQVLAECYRVLKPSGCLFITTPNAISMVVLRSLLAGYPPWVYELHIREYTVHDLWRELTQAGFGISEFRTIHCLTVEQNIDYSPYFQLLLDGHHETAHRGDDLFFMARKL